MTPLEAAVMLLLLVAIAVGCARVGWVNGVEVGRLRGAREGRAAADELRDAVVSTAVGHLTADHEALLAVYQTAHALAERSVEAHTVAWVALQELRDMYDRHGFDHQIPSPPPPPAL